MWANCFWNMTSILFICLISSGSEKTNSQWQAVCKYPGHCLLPEGSVVPFLTGCHEELPFRFLLLKYILARFSPKSVTKKLGSRRCERRVADNSVIINEDKVWAWEWLINQTDSCLQWNCLKGCVWKVYQQAF